MDGLDATRRGASPFGASIRADPQELARLRHRFRSWLGEATRDDQTACDLLLAVHEAAAHAIEVSEPSDLITIHAAALQDEIAIKIISKAQWTTPTDGERDELWLINALVNELVITPDGIGTVLKMRHASAPTLDR